MKKGELIYKLSVALFCSIFGMIVSGGITYLITIYLFSQNLNEAIYTIVIFALLGSQLGIGFGLKLANKLYKGRKNTF